MFVQYQRRENVVFAEAESQFSVRGMDVLKNDECPIRDGPLVSFVRLLLLGVV